MKDQDKKDRIIRNIAIGAGITTGVCFILSMIAFIEWPLLFKPLAFGMIFTAIVFLVFRSAFKYRNTFKVRK